MTTVKHVLALVVLALATTTQAGIESLLEADGKLWQAKADEFLVTHREFEFRWVSASAKDTARAAGKGQTFLGLPVFETLARFEQGTLNEITVSLYNRGDAGDLGEGEFQKFMAGVDEKLTGWVGAKGVLFRTQERTTVVAIQRKSWIKGPHRIDLVWSFSEKSRNQGVTAVRPEYARLQITQFDPAQDPRKSVLVGAAGQPKPISPLELRARVKREPSGDVLIAGVPMVDQGQKGYCAAAVTERVLRYYGRKLDQHEIAQLANTSAGGGTNPDQMVAALRRIGDETRLDVTVLADFNARDFEKLMTDYNRAAKHVHKPEVEFMHREGNTIYVESPVTVYKEMDTDLLKETRLKRDSAMIEFRNTVTKYINNGAPLAWCVVVGKVKEKPDPQGFGGHMRLIIGYNDRNQEILYTDTWGAGHELKRMSLADAWTTMLGLYCLQPREIRF